MERVANRVLKIQFNADTVSSMRWNFKPQQYEIKVCWFLFENKSVICIVNFEYFCRLFQAKLHWHFIQLKIQPMFLLLVLAHTMWFHLKLLHTLIKFNVFALKLNSSIHMKRYSSFLFQFAQVNFYFVSDFCFVQVDMPVFFFIDPEFAEDPKMEFVETIILSYTFFEAKDGMSIPVPSYVRSHWYFLWVLCIIKQIQKCILN